MVIRNNQTRKVSSKLFQTQAHSSSTHPEYRTKIENSTKYRCFNLYCADTNLGIRTINCILKVLTISKQRIIISHASEVQNCCHKDRKTKRLKQNFTQTKFHCASSITLKCVTSAGAHFRGIASGQTQFRRNIATVASHWRPCVRFEQPRN